MHPALVLLSFLTWGVSNLSFGAAAPLPSATSSSPKDHNLNLPHLERRELPNPSLLLHAPQVTKRWEHYLPTEASPTEVKRSEATPHLTPKRQDDLPIEGRSQRPRDEEPRGWSSHDTRNSNLDIDNQPNHPTGIKKTARKDPNWDEERKCWAPEHSPQFFGFIGASSAVAFWVFVRLVRFLLGLPVSAQYFSVWLEYEQASAQVNLDRLRLLKDNVVSVGTGDYAKDKRKLSAGPSED